MDQAKIEELKAAHPGARLYLYTHPQAGEIVYRGPSRAAWDMFQDRMVDASASKSEAFHELARAVVVFPDAGVFAGVCASYPALPGVLAKLAREAAGDEVTARGKAL